VKNGVIKQKFVSLRDTPQVRVVQKSQKFENLIFNSKYQNLNKYIIEGINRGKHVCRIAQYILYINKIKLHFQILRF